MSAAGGGGAADDVEPRSRGDRRELPPAGIWSPARRVTTLGATGLVFLTAFEALAVTTVMPLVSRDLGGEALYALAFSAPLAVSIVGMVAAGGSADRNGPRRPLTAAIALFALGLLLAGIAPGMIVLLLGRALQGLGSGAITVALYVLVARAYPESLHPRVFGAFAAAWVLPSLVGPVLAGLVAEHSSWRWVFLGVLALVPFAGAAVLPSARAASAPNPDAARMRAAPVLLAAASAAAVLGVGALAGAPSPATVPAVLGLVVVLLIALRPLLPPGTLVARRGTPSVLLARAAVAAAFFGAEVYLPYLLIERDGLSPSIAGLTLTGAAITWAAASNLQARLGERASHERVVLIGVSAVATTTGLVLAAALAGWPPAVLFAAWLLGGAGMGLAFPRFSTLVLARAPESERGFASSAMTTVEAVAGALLLAVSGIVVAGLATAGGVLPFSAAFAIAALAGVAAVLFSLRMRR